MTLFTANVKSKMAFAKKNSQNYLPNFENRICASFCLFSSLSHLKANIN